MATTTTALVEHLRSVVNVVGEPRQVTQLEAALRAGGWTGTPQVSAGTQDGMPCRIRSYPNAIKNGLLVARFRLGQTPTLEVVRGLEIQAEEVKPDGPRAKAKR